MNFFEDVSYFMLVNYLHSHGMAHTDLSLENVHVRPVDKHVKVSIISFYSCLHKSLYSVLAIMLRLPVTLINQSNIFTGGIKGNIPL